MRSDLEEYVNTPEFRGFKERRGHRIHRHGIKLNSPGYMFALECWLSIVGVPVLLCLRNIVNREIAKRQLLIEARIGEEVEL